MTRSALPRCIQGFIRSFIRHDGGNLSAIFALTLVPTVGLVGMGIDYAAASKRNEKVGLVVSTKMAKTIVVETEKN